MTDWIKTIKAHNQTTRERAKLNRETLQTQGGRVWEKFLSVSSMITKEFNEGEGFVTFEPTDPQPGFIVKVKNTPKRVTVVFNFPQAFIEYTYRDIRDAKSGKFYLEANADGSVLLICLGTPCDESIEVEDAVQRVLEPVFYATV